MKRVFLFLTLLTFLTFSAFGADSKGSDSSVRDSATGSTAVLQLHDNGDGTKSVRVYAWGAGGGGSGDASAANQTTEISKLTSIDGKLPALSGGKIPVDNSGNTQPVSGTFWQATQPVSGTLGISNFPATQPVSGTL